MNDGTVYLVHFARPYRHARHYLGWTAAESVDARLARHRRGDGARLLRALVLAGIEFEVVRTWPGGRTEERKLKRRHSGPSLCPICCQVSPGQQGDGRMGTGQVMASEGPR